MRWPKGYPNPLKYNGLIRVKNGLDTTSVRVWKTRGFVRNPKFYIEKYGLIREKNGLDTSSIRVWLPTLYFFPKYPTKCDQVFYIRKLGFEIFLYFLWFVSDLEIFFRQIIPRTPHAYGSAQMPAILLGYVTSCYASSSWTPGLSGHVSKRWCQHISIPEKNLVLTALDWEAEAALWKFFSNLPACLQTPGRKAPGRSWARWNGKRIR